MQLITWVGNTDLEAVTGNTEGNGPIASTLLAESFTQVHLLYSYPQARVTAYIKWLQAKCPHLTINSYKTQLVSPVDYQAIYVAADQFLANLSSQTQESLAILISPGTPAMQAVWILLGKTKYPATFFQSTLEQGVERISIPFEIAAEFVPSKNTLIETAAGHAPANAAFDDIVTQNPEMQLLKQQASLLAGHDLPVLILGETGTGKELFARAIHNASARAAGQFIAVNCGAIPPELIDSHFFGHIKGAFTGAFSNSEGCFKQADGGTLFLDEFGELPLPAQVRLLRVLQSGELTPVGASKPVKVDVRIVAATHRDLLLDVAEGRFREDLFYRVAVGVLKLPPLRQRAGDAFLLAEGILNNICQDLQLPNHKKCSVDARKIILQQPWRGNIRELQSTLLRACLWAQGDKITAKDIQQALFVMPQSAAGILDRDVSQGIDLKDIVKEVVQHYVPRALAEAKDNTTKAAALLGLGGYQTLNNWIKKYDVK